MAVDVHVVQIHNRQNHNHIRFCSPLVVVVVVVVQVVQIRIHHGHIHRLCQWLCLCLPWLCLLLGLLLSLVVAMWM